MVWRGARGADKAGSAAQASMRQRCGRAGPGALLGRDWGLRSAEGALLALLWWIGGFVTFVTVVRRELAWVGHLCGRLSLITRRGCRSGQGELFTTQASGDGPKVKFRFCGRMTKGSLKHRGVGAVRGWSSESLGSRPVQAPSLTLAGRSFVYSKRGRANTGTWGFGS